MRIAGLVQHPKHVCCRYRLAAFQTSWEAAGHQVELRTVPREWTQRLRLWSSLGEADLVILQRRLLSAWDLMWLRRIARRLVFDFDDALFLRDSSRTKSAHSRVRQRRFAATVEAADHVVAGNQFLAEEALRYAAQSAVSVIPTCVDPQKYSLATHRHTGSEVRLIWIGSSSTLHGLEQQRALWDALARRIPRIKCKIVCDRFPAFDEMSVIRIPWSEETEAAELASADIGISWLPDHPWSRGKCGLKVLQYMAAGLPVVANPVGVQAELVVHGRTGYLADTPEQWLDAIERLASDPLLRRDFGQAGRRIVEQELSVTRGAERWRRVLRSVFGVCQAAAS